jgi:hypothetical protein
VANALAAFSTETVQALAKLVQDNKLSTSTKTDVLSEPMHNLINIMMHAMFPKTAPLAPL